MTNPSYTPSLICADRQCRLLAGLLLGLCGSIMAQPLPLITITNPSTLSCTDAVVEIPWDAVLTAYPQVDTTQLQVVDVNTGQPISYQLAHQGQSRVQQLLVQVSISPKNRLQLALHRGKLGNVVAKTYCRYVPERYDDFAWENDKIAFRIYGSALEGRSDNAYGSDIWAKHTDQLILNKWYRSEDYHKDHGEGLDYYHVGLTLGAGDVGVFLNDSIGYIHNYRSWTILDNGPLRSTFRVTYPPYTFKGITVTETKTISLDAGSQLSRVEVQIKHTSLQPLPMVVGITLRPEESPLLLDEKSGILGYWEPRHGDDGTLGVGCVFIKQPVSMLRRYQHGLAKFSVRSKAVMTYYTGGAWDKAGVITSSTGWFGYLKRFKSQLASPLRVTIGQSARNR